MTTKKEKKKKNKKKKEGRGQEKKRMMEQEEEKKKEKRKMTDGEKKKEEEEEEKSYMYCRRLINFMINNNSVYLISAHSIRFDAHGANYYYPGYARPAQRRTRQTRKNPTGTHLLHLGREKQLWIKCLV